MVDLASESKSITFKSTIINRGIIFSRKDVALVLFLF